MNIVTARPHRLLEHIVGEIGRLQEAGEPCMLLVPAQYTLQAEVEIMTRLNLPGSFLIDVLSPARLQSRVFERAGWPDRVIFDERGKRMVLSELVEQEKDSLTIYRSAAGSGAPGFISRVSALIADFKRSGMTAQEVLLRVQSLPQENAARRKLMDAAHLYAAYEQRMADQLADAEDVSAAMRNRLERSQVVRGQHVFVYGFDMLTPTFSQELLHIASLCASLTLAIETDANAAPDGRLFSAVNFSIDRLAKMAKERSIPLARKRIDTPLDAPQDIRQLEQHLFALGMPPVSSAPEHIELRAASNQRNEVHLLGARVRRMLFDGEDSADIAVVYPKGSGYAPLLENILPQYGVTVYVAQKRPASSHPLCRFLLSALAAVSAGFRMADVAECVQSGFLPLSQAQADDLCAYMEDVDLRPGAVRKPFTYIKGGGDEALAALNESRERAIAPLLALGKSLRAARTADDTIAAVVSLLEDVQAYDRLMDMRDELLAAGFPAEAEDCAQVYSALMDTLDQLHTLLGSASASGSLVQRLLSEGLTALELSALPPVDGAVICGEIGNVRTAQVKTLFALGMNDQAAASDSGLLTPDEQAEAARVTGAYLGMTASERAALAQLDELKALSGARERIVVSYALSDETGRALREGASVQALRRAFPDLPLRGGLAEEEQLDMLASPLASLEALSVRLSDAVDGKSDLGESFAQAFAALDAAPQAHEALLSVTKRLSQPPERKLNASLARSLYGRPVMSVSRLETFAQCPYRHFVRYGLSPLKTPEPGVDRAELGTLYHEAAERFTQAVTALPQFPDVDRATCDALMDEAIAPLIAGWRTSPLGESERGAAIARRIAKTARQAGRSILSQFSGGGFRPMRTELVFGQNGVAPIMLELPDGSFVYLQGRIDRVDALDDDGRVIRVIDYKSGAKKFDPTMAYWGIQLQLLLYLAAALSQLPGSRAAGFFYCRIADPTIKTASRVREEVERQLAKKLALAGVSLSDVEILRAQGASHAAMITKDGKPNARSKNALADEESLDAMVSFARRKATELAADAYAGAIDDAPAETRDFSACATCDYAAVCGFDPAVKPRRRISKKSAEDLR